MKSMRDSFFDELYNIAKEDPNVMLIVADMSAPSLDKFREDLPNQFINVGIAEQNMILIAVGLALEGKIVYCFAIEPFSSLRPLEIIKVDVSCMNIPINIIGVGAGFSYFESGPTHHTTEDISIIRSLPNMRILNPSDSIMAGEIVHLTYKDRKPTYIRLDRQKQQSGIYNEGDQFDKGYEVLRDYPNICIIATGNLVSDALRIEGIGVIDLYKLKPLNKGLINVLKNYKLIITWEEHLLNGGLGSIISELITDNDIETKLIRVGINDTYTYQYGERKDIQKSLCIDVETIKKIIEEYK